MLIVKCCMRITVFQMLVLVAMATSVLGADANQTPFFLSGEGVAITNANRVLSAILAGDPQSKTNVQALIGAQVVFVGGNAPPGYNANLLVWSNVTVEVELRPRKNVLPRSVGWDAEVLGTLTGVDFKRRVIYVRAKPENWRHTDTY
jgi:hypothetical protein